MKAESLLATLGIVASLGSVCRADPKKQRRDEAVLTAPLRPVATNYFGTIVPDPYRWMESAPSPELDAWLKAQAEHTHRTLDSLPSHDWFVQRVNQLVNPRTDVSSVRVVSGRVYYLKRLPGDDCSKLFVRDELAGRERLLLDPGSKAHVAIDYYAPSPDGRYVVYGLSANGSELSELGILDVGTGKPLPDRIDRTRGADPYWLPDSHSFFYMRQRQLAKGAPASDAYLKMRTYLHVIARNPDVDVPVFGFGVSEHVPFAETDMPLVMTIAGSHYALGVIKHGGQDVFTIYYAPLERVGAKTPWQRLVDVDDEVVDASVHEKELYVLTRKGAPRGKIVRTNLDKVDLLHAETRLPAGSAVLRDLYSTADGIYVRLLEGGIGGVVRIPFDRGPIERIAMPFAGAVEDLVSSPTMPGVLFASQTWVKAPAIYHYDPKTHAVVDSGLVPPSQIDMSPYTSIEVEVPSVDGQKIPLSIVYRKGLVLDGTHPTWLTGYGSYGQSIDPTFSPRRPAWLDRGGIYAIAHVRGGGEFGEEWHVAGMKQNKKNTVDDFIACARYLIDHKYTSPQHLGAEGASAGGIAVGGAITKHPELFAAALIRVGISDVVRFEQTPGGPANALEFGSAKRADEFPDLLATSPYHQVKDGVKYPAVMLTASANDARVPLWEPAKMTARLQAATTSGKPVLLRVAYSAGHGALSSITSEANAELADCYTFFYWQLGAHPAAH